MDNAKPIKFEYSDKATKFLVEDFFKFFDLLRISALYQILKPNITISQGFCQFLTENGMVEKSFEKMNHV